MSAPHAKPAHVLLTNTLFCTRSGTEVVTRDYALGLARRGWQVSIFCHALNPVLVDELGGNIQVVTDLSKLSRAPDLIHGNQHPSLLPALVRFPTTNALQTCHDALYWSDCAISAERIRRHAAVDEACRERVALDLGPAADIIALLPNSVDLTRLRKRGPLPTRPRRVLIVANRSALHVPAVEAACLAAGLEIRTVGYGVGNPSFAIESEMVWADIVVGAARIALEAMATGCAALVCDARGLAGMATLDAFQEWRAWNFGHRLLTRNITQDLVASALAAYDAADATALSEKARAEADLESGIDRLEALYREVLAETGPVDRAREAQDMASYLQRWLPTFAQASPFMAEFSAARDIQAHTQRQREEALYREILTHVPGHFSALHNSGLLAYHDGRAEAALSLFDQAIAANANIAEAHSDRGVALFDLGRLDEALTNYERSIQLRADHAAAHVNRGNVLCRLDRCAEALEAYDAALLLNPAQAEAYCGRGAALRQLGRFEDALSCFARAIALRPHFAEAFSGQGAVYHAQRRLDDAVASYDRAIASDPKHADAWSNRSCVLLDLDRPAEALFACEQALSLNPRAAEAYLNRGNILQALGRLGDAEANYADALALNPDLDTAFGDWLHVKMRACDWTGLAEAFAVARARIEAGAACGSPFPLLAIPLSAAQQKAAAERYSRSVSAPVVEAPAYTRQMNDARIRLGYFSSDLSNHAVGAAMARVFELHDRSKFEVIAFSFGSNAANPMRARLARGFDEFIDIRKVSDREAVALSRERGIDIAVDLNGYTKGARPEIFAMRAAPVQVNFIGFPATTGAQYMDYIVADSVVIPDRDRRCYSEAIAYLSHSYLANDDTRGLNDIRMTRQELGLPEHGFVFCCFNASYKITPDVFDVWMRLLRKTEASVLWLSTPAPVAMENLRRAAADRGVAPERLIFASRMGDPRMHLARHRFADLFLDTFSYNAHSTASDALRAGLPVLTKLGETFASRVAASLLTAAGLPELITDTAEDYEALALELAQTPALLAALRGRLADPTLTRPLFDTELFTRGLEAAFHTMWTRSRSDLPPASFFVSSSVRTQGFQSAEAVASLLPSA